MGFSQLVSRPIEQEGPTETTDSSCKYFFFRDICNTFHNKELKNIFNVFTLNKKKKLVVQL